MKVFVVGCGSIGRRHLKNLLLVPQVEVLAYDPSPNRLSEVTQLGGVVPCRSVDEGLARKPESVVVCTPPHLHVSQARQSIAAGSHVFIEKPLGDGLNQVDDLLAEASRADRVVYVGYNFRFHAGLRRVRQYLDDAVVGRVMSIRAEYGQYLPDWRPGRDYREVYTARASQGGGIILDSSHELDYVRWLGGEVEWVSCVSGKLSHLAMDAEDAAEITLSMKKNVMAQVHMDCVQPGYTRSCKVIGEQGVLLWDFMTGVRRYEAGTRRWHIDEITPDTNDMYREEMQHFLMCVRGEARPLVDGETGKRVLEIALAAKQSAATRSQVELC